MRVFGSTVEAVKEIERDLAEMGHKVTSKSYQDKLGEYESKELVGYSFMLTGAEDWLQCFDALGMHDPGACVKYVLAEVNDRIKGEGNPGLSWTQRPEVWKQFLENNGRFSYTYADRIGDQFNKVADLVNEDPGTRQGIIQIYDKELDYGRRLGKRRIPCTMHYQVLKRHPHLYLIHSMRSCDLYTHFAIDMCIGWFLASFLTGRTLSIHKPILIMQFGSLHGFRKDIEERGVF